MKYTFTIDKNARCTVAGADVAAIRASADSGRNVYDVWISPRTYAVLAYTYNYKYTRPFGIHEDIEAWALDMLGIR